MEKAIMRSVAVTAIILGSLALLVMPARGEARVVGVEQLTLWMAPNGYDVEKRTVVCYRPCRVAKKISRAYLAPQREGWICLPRYFGPSRAGAFYRGRFIALFSLRDSCAARQWEMVAPIYKRHFAS